VLFPPTSRACNGDDATKFSGGLGGNDALVSQNVDRRWYFFEESGVIALRVPGMIFSERGVIAMRKRAIPVFAVAVGLLIVSVPLFAHHGSAVFDPGKKLTLKGTVTEWFWSNPHCLLQFDVKSDDGQVAHWIGETQNPAVMVDGGWSKQSFKPGDQVTVTLQPVKNGRPMGRLMTVVLPNGNTLDASAGTTNGSKSQNNPK
jgi:hypothetical protein